MTITSQSTGPDDCVCGYQGDSPLDLAEHIIAASVAGDPDDHAPANP